MTKSFAWSFLEQGGSKAIGLLVQIVLARLLAPEAFGLLAIMLVVVEVANSISQSGLGTALIQSTDTDDLSCTTAFWLSMGLSAVLYAIIFLTAPLIAEFYGMPELCNCLRVIALAMPINAANSIQRSVLQKNMDFKAIFKSNTAAVTLAGIAGIVAALAGFGVWALVLQTVAQPAVACVAMALQVPWRPSIAFDAGKAKALFSYGWKICITGIFSVIYRGVSELIIGKACSAGQLGYYSQGRKWPNAGMHVMSYALQNVMFPAFAAMQDDAERLKAAIKKALAVGNYVVVPVALLAAAVAEPMVVLLLGEKWLPCVPVFQVTCIANCVLILQIVNLRAYMALGDSALYLKLQIIKVTVSCVFIWTVAVLTADIYWTAITTAACGTICPIVFDLHPAKRMHGVSRAEQLRMFAPTLALALVAALAAWALTFTGLPYIALLPLQIVLFAVIYLPFGRLFKIPGQAEFLETLKSLVKSK